LRFYTRLEFIDNISFCVGDQINKLFTAVFERKGKKFLEITTNLK